MITSAACAAVLAIPWIVALVPLVVRGATAPPGYRSSGAWMAFAGLLLGIGGPLALCAAPALAGLWTATVGSDGLAVAAALVVFNLNLVWLAALFAQQRALFRAAHPTRRDREAAGEI